MKVGVVFGTRPELIKLFSVIEELKASSNESVNIFTGQHPDLVTNLASKLNIRMDVVGTRPKDQNSLADQLAEYLKFLDKCIVDEALDGIIVQGDTVSTFAGALAGFLRGIKVFHVEAGLRSFDLSSPFPEEGFRSAISQISSMNFAPTELSKENLKLAGVEENLILVVGNTGIDALLKVTSANSQHVTPTKSLSVTKNTSHVAITLHRRENWKYLESEIYPAIRFIAESNPSVNFVFILHPNPEISDLAMRALKHVKNIQLALPMDYVEFCGFLNDSIAILTDSGGLQEEGPSLGIPTFVLRDTTERPEAISSGLLVLCGNTYDQIIKTVMIPRHSDKKRQPFKGYGDGTAAKRILERINE